MNRYKHIGLLVVILISMIGQAFALPMNCPGMKPMQNMAGVMENTDMPCHGTMETTHGSMNMDIADDSLPFQPASECQCDQICGYCMNGSLFIHAPLPLMLPLEAALHLEHSPAALPSLRPDNFLRPPIFA